MGAASALGRGSARRPIHVDRLKSQAPAPYRAADVGRRVAGGRVGADRAGRKRVRRRSVTRRRPRPAGCRHRAWSVILEERSERAAAARGRPVASGGDETGPPGAAARAAAAAAERGNVRTVAGSGRAVNDRSRGHGGSLALDAGRRQGPITGVPLTSRGQKTPVFPGLFVESTRYRHGPFASKSARIDPRGGARQLDPGSCSAASAGRLRAARRRSRDPGGDFSGRRTWPPSSANAGSGSVAARPSPSSRRGQRARPGRNLARRAGPRPWLSSGPCRSNIRLGATVCRSPWSTPGPRSSSLVSATWMLTRSTSSCRGGSAGTERGGGC